ncbi:hypothetical protein RP20_CCG020193 [Aedes albopictus]|nr:hypothetical protein RP20_CCG020193 [Aedes albopictus]
MRISKSPLTLVFALLISVGEIQGIPESKSNLLPSDCGSSVTADGGGLTVILGEYNQSRNPDCYYKNDSSRKELDPTCLETEEFGVESVMVHPDFDRRRYQNDIGLIRLDRDVTMKDHIRAICLPLTSALHGENAESYVVTTWKMDVGAPLTSSNTLLEVTVSRINSTDCEQKLATISNRMKLSERQICTDGSDQICRGSAGAPLGNSVSHNNGERFVQYGIVSIGSARCELSDVPEVYTRVASYMEWILSTIVP